MLFCNPLYFFFLLPISCILYWYAIVKHKPHWSLFILLLASTIFYCTWSWHYFVLLIISAMVNFGIGNRLLKRNQWRTLLSVGLLWNVGLLGYFKYFNFFIDNCNRFFGTTWHIENIILPLGISFYTFQQIAYLVDAYKHKVEPCSFWKYLLFVTYFPQLVAGPIVHYQEMMPQFASRQSVDWERIYRGLWIFTIGLCKKILLADPIGMHINNAYNNVQGLQWMGAWMTSLGYTMQLYFDFSGYADMAIGSALLFGIQLPENFNSPYQALTIQEFWRRWHMSLSTWLKNYIYIPLGGSHCALARICSNLFLTFLIGGIWHGAGWTFFVWGALHGLAAVVHRLWLKTGYHLNHFLSWFITFNFVNIAWVFFRAHSMNDAYTIVSKMFDFRHVISLLNRDALDQYVRLFCISLTGDKFPFYALPQLLMTIVACLALTIFLPNTKQMVERFCRPSFIKTIVLWCCFTGVVLKLFGVDQQAEFLYWQF